MPKIILDEVKKLTEEIASGKSQINAGKGIPHDQAREMVLENVSQ